jgi:hypothetical protein
VGGKGWPLSPGQQRGFLSHSPLIVADGLNGGPLCSMPCPALGEMIEEQARLGQNDRDHGGASSSVG